MVGIVYKSLCLINISFRVSLINTPYDLIRQLLCPIACEGPTIGSLNVKTKALYSNSMSQ